MNGVRRCSRQSRRTRRGRSGDANDEAREAAASPTFKGFYFVFLHLLDFHISVKTIRNICKYVRKGFQSFIFSFQLPESLQLISRKI